MIDCHVFNSPDCPYDLILGRELLSQAKIKFDFETNETIWLDVAVPFHPRDYYKGRRINGIVDVLHTARTQALDSLVNQASVKDANYDVQDPAQVAESQQHLTSKQRNDLKEMFVQHQELFSGRIGRYPHRKFHIDLIKGVEPYHCPRPYRIPQVDLPAYRKEMERQVDLGLLEKVYDTEWGFPGFIRPKKDGTIRTIEDFRELNKRIKRTRFIIPEIRDILERGRKYKFLTKIDISMCYYTLELDDESKNLCVIVTPFGKYRRTVAPQGLKPCADWTQATMVEIFNDMWPNQLEIFFDDIKVTSMTWDEHIKTVTEVCRRLQDNGFTVNPTKCAWGVDESEFLGFWFTPDGYKPCAKKVNPIMNLAEPKTLKQLRAFIGFVNFYKPFWHKRAHTMEKLTKITGIPKKDFPKHWGPEQSQAFADVKVMVSEAILLQWPDLSQPFDIETDASDYQLGAVIKQNGNPIAFFSRKLTPSQRKYTTILKELLSIVETLSEFRSLLKGNEIRVHTDHRNLTFNTLNTERVLTWRLLLEDFNPTIIYNPGVNNIEADFLSRYPLEEASPEPSDDDSNKQMNQSFLNFPPDQDGFPLNFENIAAWTAKDKTIDEMIAEDPERFEYQEHSGNRLLARKNKNNDNWKIYLPEHLADLAVDWYHHFTGHGGITRTKDTISSIFWFPRMNAKVETFVKTCDTCQKYKKRNKIYGEAPARIEDSLPWETVAVDLVGPWPITVRGHLLYVHALTVIDMATTLYEIVRIESKTSDHIANKFEETWLARYPRPIKCIHDRGGEFIGPEFQSLLARIDCRSAPITTKNPQANAVIERQHETTGNILRTLLPAMEADDVATALEAVDKALASTMHASRTAVHRTLQVSPGALAFHRDMLLPIPILADWHQIRERRQTRIDKDALKANKKRIKSHNYEVGDEVLILTDDKRKIQQQAEGPFIISQVHTNGTVTIEVTPNVYDRINIRRIRPYHRA